jgi:hypothetical protein
MKKDQSQYRVWLMINRASNLGAALADDVLRNGDYAVVVTEPPSVVTAVCETLLAFGRLDVVVIDRDSSALEWAQQIVQTTLPVLEDGRAGHVVVVVPRQQSAEILSMFARGESLAKEAAAQGVRFSMVQALDDRETLIRRIMKTAA